MLISQDYFMINERICLKTFFVQSFMHNIRCSIFFLALIFLLEIEQFYSRSIEQFKASEGEKKEEERNLHVCAF